MTMPPSPSEEDRRRISRERATLLRGRIQHTNRIRGLLFGQRIANYNPLNKNRRECLEQLRTGDGRSAPAHLKSEIIREIDRLECAARDPRPMASSPRILRTQAPFRRSSFAKSPLSQFIIPSRAQASRRCET